MKKGFFKIKNLSDLDISSFEKLMKDFVHHAQETMGFDKPVEIQFVSDPQNAGDPLGKTAYYDPGTATVAVYIDDRHPKDIMRSVSHELVHHTQNCRGDFDNVSAMGEGYAQSDSHLRDMEREAYEAGNLCFRDWEDNLKTNKKKETIYIKLVTEGLKIVSKKRRLLKEHIRKALREANAGGYCADVGVSLSASDSKVKIPGSGAGTTMIEEEDEEGMDDEGGDDYSQNLGDLGNSGDDGMVPGWLDSGGGGGGFLDDLIQKLRIHEGPVTRKIIEEIVKKHLKENIAIKESVKTMNEDKKGWGSLKTINEGWIKFLNEGGATADRVVYDEGGLKVTAYDADNEGSAIRVDLNGENIANGDYDSLAGTYFLNDASTGDSNQFESSADIAKHYTNIKKTTLKQVGREKREKAGMEPHPRYAEEINEGRDAGKQAWMKKFQDAAGNPQPPPQDFWDTATYLYNRGDDPYEAGNSYGARLDRQQDDDPMDDFNYPGNKNHYEESKVKESFGDDDYMDDLEEEFPWLAKSVKAKEIPAEIAAQLAKEYGDKEGDNPNIPHLGVTTDDGKMHAKSMNESHGKTWADYGTEDAQKGRPPSPPSPGGIGPERREWEEYMAAYKEAKGGINEYGDHETQARGGLVASGYSSDPSMDFVEDIAKTTLEGGGQLMDIAGALEREGFDANLSSGALMVQGTAREKYFIGKASNFEISPDEDIRKLGPYVLGHMESS